MHRQDFENVNIGSGKSRKSPQVSVFQDGGRCRSKTSHYCNVYCFRS